MTPETPKTQPKGKVLPRGLKQVDLKQYVKAQDKDAEQHQSQKKTLKKVDRVAFWISLALAIPLVGIIFYFAYWLFIAPKG